MVELGLGIRAKYTIIAEGARGSLAKTLINKYGLDKKIDNDKKTIHQTYGLGNIMDRNMYRYKGGLADK